MTKLHKRIVVLASLAIAIASFLAINVYNPNYGLMYHIMTSQIGMCIESNRNDCDIVIPYRLVMGFCILIIIVVMAIPTKTDNPGEGRPSSP